MCQIVDINLKGMSMFFLINAVKKYKSFHCLFSLSHINIENIEANYVL